MNHVRTEHVPTADVSMPVSSPLPSGAAVPATPGMEILPASVITLPDTQTHGPAAYSQLLSDEEQSQPALQVRDTAVSKWQALGNLHAVSCAIYPVGGKRVIVKRVRFLARALWNFSLWQHWYGLLQASPFGAVARHYPRLYEKPLRPYLHRQMTHTECYRVLREHYLFMQRHASPALMRAILANEPFLLNERSSGELQEPLIINLTYAKHMQQEGEMTLSIGRPSSVRAHFEHEWVASLTFVVQYGITGWEIFVGGIQGGHTATGREDFRRATHVFHGFRPKHLLMYVLREVAAAWGIIRIYAVSDAAHCFMRKRYRDRIHKMKSSYDEFWRDAGGQLAAHGFYLIPAGNPHRLIQTVPSRKRAQYLRRYAMLENIRSEICHKLSRTLSP